VDSYAIASAIATRFAAAAVTPPSGYEDIKVSTPDLPDDVTLFPTVLVYPPQMSDATYYAHKANLNLVYPVVLFLSKADGTPRRAKALHDWLTALLNQMDGNLRLGLSTYVSTATIENWSAGEWSYAGADYDGIRFEVHVHVNEARTFAA
jgi:hypothetical protein